MEYQKIKVANPIVEMDGKYSPYLFILIQIRWIDLDPCDFVTGDEMTRVIWKSIKHKVIIIIIISIFIQFEFISIWYWFSLS